MSTIANMWEATNLSDFLYRIDVWWTMWGRIWLFPIWMHSMHTNVSHGETIILEIKTHGSVPKLDLSLVIQKMRVDTDTNLFSEEWWMFL